MEKKEQYRRDNRLELQWIELLLFLIGEQAEEAGVQINGVTINVKKRTDRLAVWMKKAHDKEPVMMVGQMIKERLSLGPQKLYFQAHDTEAPKRRSASHGNTPSKIFI